MNTTTTVLRDIGETLSALLKKWIPELASEDSVLFDSPGEMAASASTRLSIFLYQISINPHLRNIEGKPSGERHIIFPPLAVELHYILTVYAEQRITELNITEQIARVLNDYSVLKGDILQGNLSDQENFEINIIPVNLTLDDLNKLWGTFRDKPFKLSLCYLLTPVALPSDKPLKSITRVVHEELNTYLKPQSIR